MSLDDVVAWRLGVRVQVTEAGGRVALKFPGGEVTAPLRLLPAFRFIAGHRSFAIRELPDLMTPADVLKPLLAGIPGGAADFHLTPDGKKALVRRLIVGGVLTVLISRAPRTRMTSRNNVSPPTRPPIAVVAH